MYTGETGRNDFYNLGTDFLIIQIDKLGADPFRNGAIKAGFIYEAAIDHRLHDGLPVLLRFGQDVVGLRFLQDVLIDEKIEDLLFIHFTGLPARTTEPGERSSATPQPPVRLGPGSQSSPLQLPLATSLIT